MQAGWTVLHGAAQQGHGCIIECLLEEGKADVDVTNSVGLYCVSFSYSLFDSLIVSPLITTSVVLDMIIIDTHNHTCIGP